MVSSKNTLYYVHDPICSWCWGFSKTWQEVKKLLPNSINIQYILGGLSPDNNEAMPTEMREYVQLNWKKIEQKIPGVKFNYDFWTKCSPKRSTYPACRAVIAVKNQNLKLSIKMIELIQQAYYLEAKNPSEDSTLVSLADSLNLDIDQFISDLNSKQTQQKLLDDITLAQSLGAHGFPSLVLKTKNGIEPIAIDYNNSITILNQINT